MGRSAAVEPCGKNTSADAVVVVVIADDVHVKKCLRDDTFDDGGAQAEQQHVQKFRQVNQNKNTRQCIFRKESKLQWELLPVPRGALFA
jgi:hypothetical protein